MKKAKSIVLTNGMLDTSNAKTCHGLLRGTDRFEILAVIDARFAGKDAGEVMDGERRNIPVYANLEDFFGAGHPEPEYAIVGVALSGGTLPASFRQELFTAMENGLSIVNGLHTFLSEDEEFRTTAEVLGVNLIDIRKPKPRKDLKFWSGEIFSVRAPRLAVLGTDCALGKRTTCRFIMEACRNNGIKAEMIYTGQTGWMQGYPYGFIFDTTVNDFISGEIEKAIVTCDREAGPDIILIEGQSALRNPSGPCGSEFLLSGDTRAVVLQHAPGRPCFEGTEDFHYRIPTLDDEIKLIAMYGAKVIAITLNEEHQTDQEMKVFQQKWEEKLGMPVVRPLVEGVDRLVPVVKEYLAAQANKR